MGKILGLLLLAGSLVGQQTALALTAPPISSQISAPISPSTSGGFDFFPCGLRSGKQQLLPSLLVLGREDGKQAVNLADWALPWAILTKTLKIESKTLADGRIELRSKAKVVIVDARIFRVYPELGQTITIGDLAKYLDISATFDIIDYAIVLNLPANGQEQTRVTRERPIELTGLELKTPPVAGITAIEQQINVQVTNSQQPQSQGILKATGTLLGASWYAQFNQSQPLDRLAIGLGDAQIVRYSDHSDYVLGSQPAFWNRQASNDYWGVSGLWRQGFTPAPVLDGQIDPAARRQASQLGRTVVGSAAPGTIVRLVTLQNSQIVAETLVDSTGIFRFSDVPVTTASSNYRLHLFPAGQLGASAEVRSVNFVTTPGQLPPGATATTASIGLRRTTGGFFGDFQDVRGAVVRHAGLSEWLTVGAGVAYDRGWQGIGEIFIQPNNLPLSGSLAISGSDVLGRVRWRPSPQLRAEWNLDRLSQRANLDWQVDSQLSLQANYDDSLRDGESRRDALGAGFQYLASQNLHSQSSARVNFDTNGHWRWQFRQRLGDWALENRGNEISNRSELSYFLSPEADGSNAIQLAHQSDSGFDTFSTVTWNYRSSQRQFGQYPLSLELGYGIGRAGSGWLAGTSVTLWPGVSLRGRYQSGITSDRSNFSLELVSNLEIQDQLRTQPYPIEQLRTQGGIIVIPFFDRNGNDRQDPDEASYLDPELISLNYQPSKLYRPLIENGQMSLRLPPGQYRLDLDPAGFPVDWRSRSTGYAVEVVAGSYTVVRVPLVVAYRVSGQLLNAQGQPIKGAKVAAIPSGVTAMQDRQGQEAAFSITNSSGEYYLESLTVGTYRLQVDDRLLDKTLLLEQGTPREQVLPLRIEP